MSNKNLFVTIIFLFISTFGFSQDVKGTILEIIENKEKPVVGANIYWIDNSGGTISDSMVNLNYPILIIRIAMLLVLLDIKMIP